MTLPQTPYYLIDMARLRANMEKVAHLREASGAKVLLALKCFATWSVFDLMRDYMDGTTSSSLYELRLGHETFGKETHAYSVAWADHEIDEAVGYADKIIFNSLSQLDRFGAKAAGIATGLRLNPRFSTSGFDLADMLFIGDAIFPGGNDYPAHEAGVDCVRVRDPQETISVVTAIVACQK